MDEMLAEEAIKRGKRASFLGWLAEGGLPDLTGPVETSESAGVTGQPTRWVVPAGTVG